MDGRTDTDLPIMCQFMHFVQINIQHHASGSVLSVSYKTYIYMPFLTNLMDINLILVSYKGEAILDLHGLQ